MYHFLHRSFFALFMLCLVLFVLSGENVFAQQNAGILEQNSVRANLGKVLEQGTKPIEIRRVVHEVEFNEESDWEYFNQSQVYFGVENGVYRTNVYSQGTFWYGLNRIGHTNVIIEVDSEFLSGETDNGFGLMCRADFENNGDGYYFLISSDGYFSILKYEGGAEIPLFDWSITNVLNTETSINRIMAVCIDDYLALYVNDQLMIETYDETYKSGLAGFASVMFSRSSDDAHVAVDFDNVRMWDVSLTGDSYIVASPTPSDLVSEPPMTGN